MQPLYRFYSPPLRVEAVSPWSLGTVPAPPSRTRFVYQRHWLVAFVGVTTPNVKNGTLRGFHVSEVYDWSPNISGEVQ